MVLIWIRTIRLAFSLNDRQFNWRWIILCTAASSPQKEEGRRSVCEGGGDCRQASLRWISISSSSACEDGQCKTIPVSSVFNDSEGLCRTAVCRCLVRRPHYSAWLMRFGSRDPSEFFFSDTPPKCLDRDCVGRRRSVGEKQGIVTWDCCLSATCFTNSDISACCWYFEGTISWKSQI